MVLLIQRRGSSFGEMPAASWLFDGRVGQQGAFSKHFSEAKTQQDQCMGSTTVVQHNH